MKEVRIGQRARSARLNSHQIKLGQPLDVVERHLLVDAERLAELDGRKALLLSAGDEGERLIECFIDLDVL